MLERWRLCGLAHRPIKIDPPCWPKAEENIQLFLLLLRIICVVSRTKFLLQRRIQQIFDLIHFEISVVWIRVDFFEVKVWKKAGCENAAETLSMQTAAAKTLTCHSRSLSLSVWALPRSLSPSFSLKCVSLSPSFSLKCLSLSLLSFSCLFLRLSVDFHPPSLSLSLYLSVSFTMSILHS